ncbi:hypothetical protein DY000_02054204 [Brassica cretica]|uniref:Uncharacterized protein n=1 Tax=Brassica cretica TaxID=69181 RepID=A0ABQ7AE70_BRACR|nr:hypothetical protein DY000_02054204 [Brassica cretica]
MSSLDAYATFTLLRGFFEHQALFYNALAQPLSRIEVVEKIVKLGTVTLETHTNMFSNPASSTQNLTMQPEFLSR